MGREDREHLGAALAVLRSILGWDQAKVARAAGVPASSISDYERGKVVPSPSTLERILSGMALPASALDTALDCVRTIQALGREGPLPAAGSVAASFEKTAGRLARSALELVQPRRRGRKASTEDGDRGQASRLWQRLARYKVGERRAIVQENPEFRSDALCELLCEKSAQAAADDAREARELAELALLVAELLPPQP